MNRCAKSFITSAAVLVAAPAFVAAQDTERAGVLYRVVVPDPPLHDINNRGQGIGNFVTPSGVTHGFIDTDGVRTDLGSLGGFSTAGAINDRGEVAGLSLGVDGRVHLFLYARGVMRDLGAVGEDASVSGINNRGDITGNHTPANGRNVPFLYTNGVLRDIPAYDPDYPAYSRGINDRGQVVGFAGPEQAVVWARGRVRVIGPRIAHWSLPEDINERGDIVGAAGLPGSAGRSDGRAFLYRNGQTTDLGTLGGPFAFAVAINNRGQVVGGANIRWLETGAFLYEHGRLTNLSERLIPGSGWQLEAAVDINDRGQILAWGFRDNQYRIVRLDPVGRHRH
ncbi:hypothetical protein [Massilia sp. Leaf139]|uniref:hypothetical protein n=1 Tax=Massilia sp. Leaf139 TaxID=1736272 RepID=UPI0006FE06E5|nr:hypothetical protein [Massilia sp. Leaf139]KQQ97149.1 hypothetical protein ASF77_04085 [Massilia sp. Leaf139]